MIMMMMIMLQGKVDTSTSWYQVLTWVSVRHNEDVSSWI